MFIGNTTTPECKVVHLLKPFFVVFVLVKFSTLLVLTSTWQLAFAELRCINVLSTFETSSFKSAQISQEQNFIKP